MKMVILAILLVLTVCQTDQEWENYKLKFRKQYKTKQQQATRRTIWAQNKIKIQQINSESKGFTLTQNKFTDQTKKQISQRSGFRANFVNSSKVSAFPTSLRVSAVPSVNWKTQRKVSSDVGAQGVCGSCWAFATAATAESYIAVKNTTSPPSLSVEYLLQCTGYSCDCYGGNPQQAMELAVQTGIPTAAAYPYLATYSWFGTPYTPGLCSTKATLKLPAGTQQYRYQMLTSEQLKQLVQDSPIQVGIAASYQFIYYKSGIIDCGCKTFDYEINHAVLLYGYDQKGWLIKNSWGDDWGEEGYATIAYNGSCGIQYYVWVFAGGAVTNNSESSSENSTDNKNSTDNNQTNNQTNSDTTNNTHGQKDNNINNGTDDSGNLLNHSTTAGVAKPIFSIRLFIYVGAFFLLATIIN